MLSIGVWKAIRYDKVSYKKDSLNQMQSDFKSAIDDYGEHIKDMESELDNYKKDRKSDFNDLSSSQKKMDKDLYDSGDNEVKAAMRGIYRLDEDPDLHQRETNRNIKLQSEDINFAKQYLEFSKAKLNLGFDFIKNIPNLNLLAHLNEQSLFFYVGVLFILGGFILQILGTLSL